MAKYEYMVIGEEADFEPIEADDIYEAQNKIRHIVANKSVWSHGVKPFTATVKMTSEDGKIFRFDTECATEGE